MPPDHTIRRPGSKSVTFTGNARPGLALTCTLIFAPGAIVPSTRSTPESHPVMPGASVSTAQIASGGAWMSAVAS